VNSYALFAHCFTCSKNIRASVDVNVTNCNRCHQARPGSERTDLERIAIVAHMRASANFTKSQAVAVLAFLQATNLPEPGAAQAAAGTTTVIPDSLRAALYEAAAVEELPRPAAEPALGDPERTPNR